MERSLAANTYQLIILGAGASGLICAAEAAGRGLSVLLIDHRNRPAGKLLASGGGACNITNREVAAENYRSDNPHFCRSALSRFGSAEVLEYFALGGGEYEERDHGRVFTRKGAKAILDFLIQRCRERGVGFAFGFKVGMPEYRDGEFHIDLDPTGRNGSNDEEGHCRTVAASHLVLALGSPVRPDLGGSDFGFSIARRFGHQIIAPTPALTRLRWAEGGESIYAALSGISLPVMAGCEGGKLFYDELLFAHRGDQRSGSLSALPLVEAGDEN